MTAILPETGDGLAGPIWRALEAIAEAEGAVTVLKPFLKSYPKDTLSPDALLAMEVLGAAVDIIGEAQIRALALATSAPGTELLEAAKRLGTELPGG